MKNKPLICNRYKVRLHNEEQEIAWDSLERNYVSFLLGVAGTGKTFLAIAWAMQALQDGRFEKIVLSRPVVEAGERLGFLPGTLTEKIDPYMMPLYDALSKVTGRNDKTKLPVEVLPLAYMRGRTFTDAVCILDEAQNATYDQLKMFLTRMGKNSKMVLTGDPQQSDLNGKTALGEVCFKLKGCLGVSCTTLTSVSVMRHPIVAEIVRLL